MYSTAFAVASVTTALVVPEPFARAADLDAAIGMDSPLPPPPGSSGTFELSGHGGFVSPPIRGGTNPFGGGYGARFGYAQRGFYGGVDITNFVGSTDVSSSEHAVLYGAEVGYGLVLPVTSTLAFTLRPTLGAGGMTLTRTDPKTAATTSSALSTSSTKVPKLAPSPDVISSASTSTGGSSGGSGVVSSGGTSGSGTSSTTSSNTNTTTVSAFYVEPGFVAMFGSDTYFAAVDTSVLVLPTVAYGGADGTTWLAYGVSARLGVKW